MTERDFRSEWGKYDKLYDQIRFLGDMLDEIDRLRAENSQLKALLESLDDIDDGEEKPDYEQAVEEMAETMRDYDGPGKREKPEKEGI